MANTMTVDQVSAVLRKVLSQATGRTDLAALDTAQLLTIGKTELLNGADPILETISQMVTKTIFSARPYTAKFAQLRMDDAAWGNVVRKLKIVDKETDVDDNSAYKLKEGASIDMYQVDNAAVIQLNFCGQQTYTIEKTIYKDQLNTCFNSAEEFGRFISMILTYVANKVEKIHEEEARATVAGAIGGIVAEQKNKDAGRVVHLVTEFTAETGLPGEGKTIYDPAIFDSFVKWVFARVENISSLMTEYSAKYHTNLTGKLMDQHTPVEKQLGFFYEPFFQKARNRVLADTFHNDLLKLLPRAEMVNFWQSIDTPDSINLSHANYLAEDGTITDGGALTQAGIFGIIADDEMMGYSPIITDTAVTPYNAKGKYWNYFWHFNERHYIDFTEKAVVLLLD